jgi:hypothetical protein
MNRSYSKIRHIQESNIKLEKRTLNEQLDNRKIDHGMGAILDRPTPADMISSKDLYSMAKNMGFKDVRGRDSMEALQLTTEKMVITINFMSGGAIVTKKPIIPPSFTDEKGVKHGMGLLPSPLKIDYVKMDIKMVTNLLMNYIKK